MTSGQRLRQLANLLNASTPLGLLLAACARCPVRRGPRGLLIATGYRWRLPFAAAFTVGNVVLFRGGPARALGNPALLGHEERHSTQYAWCLGVPFLPLYFLAAVWSWWRTGNPGSANPFERHAGLRAGGYPPAFPGTFAAPFAGTIRPLRQAHHPAFPRAAATAARQHSATTAPPRNEAEHDG